MAYSTIADVRIAAGGESTLRELSDVDRTGQVNTAAVESAIAEADAIINSHIHLRHSVDVSAPVPPVIRHLSARMAVYVLKRRRKGLIGEADNQAHEMDLEQLRSIRKGETTMGVYPEPNRSEKIVAAATEATLDRSRASLKGFC